jgi:hypothetical protein
MVGFQSILNVPGVLASNSRRVELLIEFDISGGEWGSRHRDGCIPRIERVLSAAQNLALDKVLSDVVPTLMDFEKIILFGQRLCTSFSTGTAETRRRIPICLRKWWN